MSNSRKSRRNQLRAAGYLKIKNMYNPLRGAGAAWYKKMREDGKALHEYNVNKVKEQLEEFLQTKANSLKTTWIEIGYNETECSKLEEAFFIRNVKNKELFILIAKITEI